MSIHGAAVKYGVPVQTLHDRVTGVVDPECVTMGPQPILSQEHEARLVNHVKYMASLGYGYTRQEVTDMATDYCIMLNIKSGTDKPLSLKWFRGFIKRWPELKVVKPRSLEYQRAKSANPENIRKYYEELSGVLDKYGLRDKPHRIYNVDEKGITLNHKPPQVVAGIRHKPSGRNIRKITNDNHTWMWECVWNCGATLFCICGSSNER